MLGIGLWLAATSSAAELPKKVGKELAKACEQGDASSCVELTELLLDRGIAKFGQGPAAAAPWARRACDRGLPRGCQLQGHTLEATLPRRRMLDGRQIARWYAGACDAEVPAACDDLHRFLHDWEADLAMPADEVHFMISMACQGGVAAACDEEPEPALVGRVTQAGIIAIVRAALPGVQTCGQHGSVHVTFTVSGEGHVTQLELASDDVSDPAVWACVEAKVDGLRFPKPVTGAFHVTHVYRLEP